MTWRPELGIREVVREGESAESRSGDVFDEFEWGRRDVAILDASGSTVFFQSEVEAPARWSDTAVNVVASKYFRGNPGDPDREDSVRTLVDRVTTAIAGWAVADGYLDAAGGERLRADLVRLVLSQSLAFNTPVWLNVGVEDVPLCSACYISSVEDSMESIMDLARAEARIFKSGGGSGANLSALRGAGEPLAGGGTASGPVSFMRGFDAFAGVIKSGGRMRRAAKMVVLNVGHPDVREFVRSKGREEAKARALEAAGYDGGIDGDAYSSVFFQNANHSVRVTDGFMRAVESDGTWELRGVRTGEVVERVPARELFREIAETAWACGDPGLQFDDEVNRWNTCATSGRINGSNPCAEFVFLDDSACNLASLNLRRFQGPDGGLDVERFRRAVDVAVLAQEVVVGRARYPTERIERNAKRFRPIGLGYANLGAFLMAAGLPYDSDDGRGVAASITALMTARAYRRSAQIAAKVGAFEGFDENRGSVLAVLGRHLGAFSGMPSSGRGEVEYAAIEDLTVAIETAKLTGVRNAQVTVLAPTGTIAFMMDCDTTGIEPDFALVKTKKLVGGGTIRSVNGSIRDALRRLGYVAVDGALEALEREGTFVGSGVREEHLPVFDCAAVDAGGRSIAPDGHLRMLTAVQPFLSGAISKTVNLPENATVEDVERVYLDAWRLGLKAISIYRDGSKGVQPLSPVRPGNGGGRLTELDVGGVTSTREKLPDECRSVRWKFEIAGELDGYVHAGLHPDGRVGEIFIRLAKEGTALSGLADALATAVSIGLQYGVPLPVFVEKFSHWRFEPSGYTSDPGIGFASSIVDLVFRWLDARFPGGYDVPEATPNPEVARVRRATAEYATLAPAPDAPFCPTCSTQLRRNGSCFVCPTCGGTTGCS